MCAELFARPIIEHLQGAPGAVAASAAVLGGPVAANGPRDHYMRARLEVSPDGVRRVRPFDEQDSARATVLAAADCLLRRTLLAPAAEDGSAVEIIEITG